MSFGVYVHIPFCTTRCSYCHFVTRPWQAATGERYYRAVVREMKEYFRRVAWADEADSIYFGGGTPSMVPAEHIAAILRTCRDLFAVSSDCEISLEANPGSVTCKKAESYRRMGVNRISLGAQTFDDDALAAIGRDHTAKQIEESVELLRQREIQNLSVDALLGLPGQTGSKWNHDLDRICRIRPAHVSIYMLDLDERSPLYHLVAKGRYAIPEDDMVSDLYLQTLSVLRSHGYEHYEISNFAQPGFESRHNLKYWKREPVLGFGVGSHSFDGKLRSANHSKMSAYLEAVEGGRAPVDWSQSVNENDRLAEILFLGLRLSRGLDWSEIRREYSTEKRIVEYEAALHDWSQKGLLEWRDSVVRLTPSGMLVSNEMFQTFV